MMFQLEVSNNYDGLDLEESSHIRVLCIYFHILKCSIYYLYGISWISHPSLTKKTICLNPFGRNETLWQPLFVVDPDRSMMDNRNHSFISLLGFSSVVILNLLLNLLLLYLYIGQIQQPTTARQGHFIHIRTSVVVFCCCGGGDSQSA